MELKKVKTVIVGGGVQAVALALRCIELGHRDFVIVDPQPLMNEWIRNIEAQGINNLRTPFSAHIAPTDDPEAMLINMQTGRPLRGMDPTQPAHSRLFNSHAQRLIKDNHLENFRFPGQVKNIEHLENMGESKFLVTARRETKEINYVAQNVVCAIGLGKPWMPDLCVAHPRVMHSHYVDIRNLPYGDSFCIVGSGLTAATLALAFSEQGAHVDLCGRSQMSVMQLETDPGWRPGERLQKIFTGIEDTKERVRQLKAARTANVVTPDIWDRLTVHLEFGGSINIHTGVSVEGVEIASNNKVRINERIVDGVIFATGYKVNAQELPMLKGVKDDLIFEDGLPELTNDFESTLNGLYFMGKLGELAGGPLMRNIPGARYASKRIAERIA